MMDNNDWSLERLLEVLAHIPPTTWVAIFLAAAIAGIVLIYAFVYLAAPTPRPPQKSEKTFLTILPDGQISKAQDLPCWHDAHVAKKELALGGRVTAKEAYEIEDAEIFMSVVVPAYNEQERLSGMLEEAVEYLSSAYPSAANGNAHVNGSTTSSKGRSGWEILVVSDGSKDQTVNVALDFAKEHQLAIHPSTPAGPWTSNEGVKMRGKSAPKSETKSTHIPHGSIRVVQLEENRGKGGAVTHGMRHVRGEYAVFADADGASRFSDLGKLVEGCERVKDSQGRAVGLGSRAHLVGSEAVVKRSLLRNTLMRSFHLLLWLMTPPATAAIKDTQCGFKLFSRASLPYIIPYMHCEGWIFDVEMLMLAESAKIPMAEVAIGWKEVKGSKLNVIWDSLGMAWGLALLRAAWILGLYKRDV